MTYFVSNIRFTQLKNFLPQLIVVNLEKSLKIAFTNEMCMMKKFIYISSAPSYEFMREDDGCYFLFQERLLVPKGLMQQNFL